MAAGISGATDGGTASDAGRPYLGSKVSVGRSEFEPASDDKSFFYPHGWGRAFVIPTNDKRQTIERFLSRWQSRLGPAMLVTRVSFIVFAMVYFSTRSFYPLLGATWCFGLTSTIQQVLIILAETTGADLERTQQRQRFTTFLRDSAHKIEQNRFRIELAYFILVTILGLSWLTPQSESVMIQVHPSSFDLWNATSLMTIGLPMSLIRLWQVHVRQEIVPSS
jgi:hypothetical protein